MHTSTPPILIAGGGPVGLTLAALLAKLGVPYVVLEADSGYCTGSRAICVSRRSQEILGWVGADAALVAKGLAWTGGRSYWCDHGGAETGNAAQSNSTTNFTTDPTSNPAANPAANPTTEVLHFTMPTDPTQRFAPMVNIQQFYVEEYAHHAALRLSPSSAVRWNTRLEQLQADAGGVSVTLANGETLRGSYLVACDGGRSTVRERLGLQLEGMQYEGRYVIADIRQKTQRPVERLAWFDPPSNPGSTLLMHRQPDDVWRIDYQIEAHEDAAEAIKPENVLPRVQRHLDMIGEHAPWEMLWISIYNAKCLTLPSYRPTQGHGRVFFAGDAAHLVPIFGVRGLNSGLDDVGNLAWKLASVWHGETPPAAADALLDSYSTERVAAARENMRYGAKSTEFMAPPHFGFELMRQAALRLATQDACAAQLINPRQSLPVAYSGSALCGLDNGFEAGAASTAVGLPAPEAFLNAVPAVAYPHISQYFGGAAWTLLCFDEQGTTTTATTSTAATGEDSVEPSALPDLNLATAVPLHSLQRLCITPEQSPQAWQRFAARHGSRYLIRPDGYIAARWQTA